MDRTWVPVRAPGASPSGATITHGVRTARLWHVPLSGPARAGSASVRSPRGTLVLSVAASMLAHVVSPVGFSYGNDAARFARPVAVLAFSHAYLVDRRTTVNANQKRSAP